MGFPGGSFDSGLLAFLSSLITAFPALPFILNLAETFFIFNASNMISLPLGISEKLNSFTSPFIWIHLPSGVRTFMLILSRLSSLSTTLPCPDTCWIIVKFTIMV